MHSLDDLLRERPSLLLKELVRTTNEALARLLLPDPQDARVKTQVTKRLIRHYVQEGTIDPGIRDGRNSVYTVDHVLQLLALRRLLAAGFSSSSIGSTLRHCDRDELRATAEGRASPEADPFATAAEAEVSRAQSQLRATIDAIRRRTGELGTATGNDLWTRPSGRMTEAGPGGAGVVPPMPSPPTSGTHTVQAWDRVPLLDGVELHVRTDLRLPTSVEERQRLLDHVIRMIVLYAQARDP